MNIIVGHVRQPLTRPANQLDNGIGRFSDASLFDLFTNKIELCIKKS